MNMRKIYAIIILSAILACSPKVESTNEFKILEEYLIHENGKEINELDELSEQLADLGRENIDRSKISVIDSLHRAIVFQYNRDKKIENLPGIEDILLSTEKEIRAEFPFISNSEKTQYLDLPSPLASTMYKMNNLISLTKNSLWAEYISKFDGELLSFSFSEEINEGKDSSICFFGIYRSKALFPKFSTTYNRLSVYQKSTIGQIRVANKDLNNNKVRINILTRKQNGELVDEEITPGKKFQLNKIN